MITRKKIIYLVLVLLLILVGVVVTTFISDGTREHKRYIANQKVPMRNNLNHR